MRSNAQHASIKSHPLGINVIVSETDAHFLPIVSVIGEEGGDMQGFMEPLEVLNIETNEYISLVFVWKVLQDILCHSNLLWFRSEWESSQRGRGVVE